MNILETVIVTALSAVIGSGLVTFLGRKWVEHRLNKNLEEFRASLVNELDIIRHELNLIHSSFKSNIENVFEYFSIIYRYYRLCQEVSLIDIIKTKEGESQPTRKRFEDRLDQVVEDWKVIEGRIRLILPDNILQIHKRLIDSFNSIRTLVKSYKREEDKPKEELKSAFKELHQIKDKMESSLKMYLRSEKVIM